MGTQKQKKSSKKKAAVLVTAGILGLATAGGAYSYWSSLGAGTGTASTRDGSSSIFAVTGGAATAMYPGDTAQNVTATVKNNGTENYKAQDVKAYLTTGNGGCDGSDYLINGVAGPTTSGTAVSLGLVGGVAGGVDLAPDATTTVGFTLKFNNKATNQDACQGAVVTIHYIAS